MLAVYIILGLAASATLLLCVPIDMRFEAVLDKPRHLDVTVVWLFGLIKKHLESGKENPPLTHVKTKGSSGWRLSSVLRLLRTRGLMRRICHLIRDLIKSVHFREVSVDLQISLGDPAETGMLFAMLAPMTVLIGSVSRFPLSSQPTIQDEPCLGGCCSGTVRVVPLRSAVPIVQFIFSRPAMKASSLIIKERWKR